MKFHHSKACVQKLELMILINHNDDDYINDDDVDARRLCKMWATKMIMMIILTILMLMVVQDVVNNDNDDNDSDVDARRLCKMWPTKSNLGSNSNRQHGDEATGWRRIFSR